MVGEKHVILILLWLQLFNCQNKCDEVFEEDCDDGGDDVFDDYPDGDYQYGDECDDEVGYISGHCLKNSKIFI